MARLQARCDSRASARGLETVAANLARQYPDTNKLQTIGPNPSESGHRNLRTAGLLVLGAVGSFF